MKKIFFVLAVLLLAGCAGMERSPDAGKPIEFVLEAPGKTKDQIFSATKSWIAETFVSGKSVMDDADKESGRIIAKGRVKHPCGEKSYACGETIDFTLRIDIKDGKIRATYTNAFDHRDATEGRLIGLTYVKGEPEHTRELWMVGEIADANKAFRKLSDELQQYITSESVGSKNW